MEKIIAQGAEAILIKKEAGASSRNAKRFDINSNRRSEATFDEQLALRTILVKRRIKKSYRLPELDEKLRKLRTRSEAKLLEKAGKIIPTPRVINVSENSKEIQMEFLNGKKLSESLDELKNWKEVCQEIGQNIAKLHDADIIHGDLTTSNMILIEKDDAAQLLADRINNCECAANSPSRSCDCATRQFALARRTRSQRINFSAPSARHDKHSIVKNSREFSLIEQRSLRSPASRALVYFIDYGLGFANGKIEDKAVDLHLIKQALEAKHFQNYEKFWKAVLEGYKISKNCKETLKRLEKVEKRGRYKQQF
jgi:tRNA A-37 threonylcarbamoyl transferase component Bud32